MVPILIISHQERILNIALTALWSSHPDHASDRNRRMTDFAETLMVSPKLPLAKERVAWRMQYS